MDSNSSRPRTHCRDVSCWKSWKNYGCLANSRVTCLHPVPSVLCWMYLWTVIPPALRDPAPSAPRSTAAPSSQNPHTALSVCSNPIDPRADPHHPCQCPTGVMWLPNGGGRLWGTAAGEPGGRRVLTAWMEDLACRRATQRSASVCPHSDGAEPLWLMYLSSTETKVHSQAEAALRS